VGYTTDVKGAPSHFECKTWVADFWRSKSKILTSVTSLFTSSYVYNWSTYFPKTKLEYPPMFDGRLVVYPGEREVKDYFAWRQADSESPFHSTLFSGIGGG